MAGGPEDATNKNAATQLEKDGLPDVKIKSHKNAATNITKVQPFGNFPRTELSGRAITAKTAKLQGEMVARLKSALTKKSIRERKTLQPLMPLLLHLLLSPKDFHAGTVANVHDGKTLLIDADVPFKTHGRTVLYAVRYNLTDLGVKAKEIIVRKSSSGRCHVVAHLAKKYDDFAILFMQLYCGDDRHRSACNFKRFQFRTDPHAQILFGRKIPLTARPGKG